MTSRLLSTLAALAVLAPAAARALERPARPLAEVLAEAARTGKPVLLDFGTVW